jgi:nitroimidazol reductase NimA-like FMN-containing flavoprotein (pyridoxamine 5'-phosphate oxidase superfamily)
MNHLLVGEDRIYFHSGKEGERISNLRNNPYASFFVVGYHDVIYSQFTAAYSSAVVQGRISIIADEEERRFALTSLVRRYTSHELPEAAMLDYIEEGLKRVEMLRLDIESVTGKARNSRIRPGLLP